MYLPPAFREDDLPTLHAAIRAAGLATLVTTGPDGLIATPVPMLFDPEPAPYGTLVGHLARANPQCRPGAPKAEALALFQGPDFYVSPAWYPTKQETGKVVPTWNYVAVHAHGRIAFFDDPAELRALVARLTDRHEAGRATPWSVDDAPADFIAAQLKSILGFRLRISRLEGKWKLSQNRNEADRAGVVAGLTVQGDAAHAALVARPKG
jgi:transcriptional regulator